MLLGSLFVSAVFSAALAFPVEVEKEKQPVPILFLESHQEPGGGYDFKFESGDGTQQEQTGEFKTVGADTIESVHGSYQWNDDKGNPHSVKFVADENGYQAFGADIPVGPPTPDYVVKMLEYIATHPPVENEIKKDHV